MLCYAMLCYAMLCYAMLCYAMLCYAMLCYAVSKQPTAAPFMQELVRRKAAEHDRATGTQGRTRTVQQHVEHMQFTMLSLDHGKTV